MTALKISEAASLAIHTMVVLAANPNKSVSTGEIASALHVSKDHLSKVLQRLAKAGFVKSQRGPKGGFTLEKPGDSITLLDVYESIEGAFAVHNCFLTVRVCGADECVVGKILHDANARYKEFLTGAKLTELVEKLTEQNANILGGDNVNYYGKT